MTVCAVIEHWDNCEGYGDHVSNDAVIAIAGNPSTAELIVAKRKAELLKLTSNGKATTRDCVDRDDCFDGIWIHWYDNCDIPTGRYSFGYELYEWEIKDFEVQEEP